jgi:hypothetical protein
MWLCLTDLAKVSEASNAMSTIPSAQYMKDPEPVGYDGRTPPSYDQAMGPGHNMPHAQPVPPPYPPHNGK